MEAIQGARQAVLAMDLFKPFLEKEKEDLIAKLKQQFRNNEHELSVYIGLISTLVALDDMEAKILRKINAGKAANEKAKVNHGT